MKKELLLVTSAVVVGAASGGGFGLYEGSARGNALGGALVGSTKDASAVYYNPANMTESTNMSVLAGATVVGLYSDVRVNGERQARMNPGLFCIPHVYVTSPLPHDFALGLGLYCEDGLGTKYGENWKLAGDTVETTMEQFSLNPNLAYKITEWWSVAAGLKMSYITFNSSKHPYAGMVYGPYANAYRLSSELDGDDLSMGYDFGTTFRLREDLGFGIVYRSQIKHDISGDFDMDGTVVGKRQFAHSDASARLTLPQSLTAGLNWEATEAWRLGASVTWTQWSSVETIVFKIPATGGYALPLNWDDVWRFGFGSEYDLTESLTVRGGYVYDMDPSSENYGTTMLPGGDRHILCLGFGWMIWETLRLDVGYNLVFVCDGSREITVAGKPPVTTDMTCSFENIGGYSHMLSASLSYSF